MTICKWVGPAASLPEIACTCACFLKTNIGLRWANAHRATCHLSLNTMRNRKVGKVVFALGLVVSVLATAITIAQFALDGSISMAFRGLLPATLLMITGNNLIQRSTQNQIEQTRKPALVIALVFGILVALALVAALLFITLSNRTRF